LNGKEKIGREFRPIHLKQAGFVMQASCGKNPQRKERLFTSENAACTRWDLNPTESNSRNLDSCLLLEVNSQFFSIPPSCINLRFYANKA
jgi:hypothetical protein